MMSAPLFTALVLMTALAVMAVLWPLSRRPALKDARGADLAVYRDQLAEIARDRASGRLPADEAEAARVEVARRMLAADAAAESEDTPDSAAARTRRRIAALAALLILPLGAAALYAHFGSPSLPGAPLAERLSAPPDRGDVAILVRKVEAHLAQNPQDGQGYEILAPVYMRMGRPDDAAFALRQAIRILGPTPARQADLGEALVVAGEGIVSADAAQAFSAALALDPANPKGAYYLGLAAEQDGRRAAAAQIWSRLAAAAPPGAPWLPMVNAALARVGASPASPQAAPQSPPPPRSPDAPAAAAPGPSAQDVAAAAALSAQDRASMISGMVDRLAERLRADPRDLEGWLRLSRAYMVLGEKDKAKEALATARSTFATDNEALARIDAAEKDLATGG